MFHANLSCAAIEDQLDVTKKHLEQFKEIGNTNEQAINDLTKVAHNQAITLKTTVMEIVCI